ncbi:MAG: hypothetical protein POG74_05055 [Acidocella sp.]|nr:hypothetical protein [Acidocella sp.]
MTDLARAFSRDILPRDLGAGPGGETGVQFTIGVLVTKKDEYVELLESFHDAGFGTDDCEYIFIDNTKSNQADGYTGLNRILNEAKGRFVILCHQDVRLCFDHRPVLETKLLELDKFDKNWGLAGNAGADTTRTIAIRITHFNGREEKSGRFPAKVMSLDENFIIVKKSARLGFSNDLTGFHFYGTDICLQADIKGFNAYVIDFHLHHLGLGIMGEDFFMMRKEFKQKWDRALRVRLVKTTCITLAIGQLVQLEWGIIRHRTKNLQKSFDRKLYFYFQRLVSWFRH